LHNSNICCIFAPENISGLCNIGKITIQEGIITGSLPRRVLRLVYEWLDQHQDELMANWERLGKAETPLKISPLQ